MPDEDVSSGLPWWPSPEARRAAQAARRRARRQARGPQRGGGSRERTTPEAIVAAAVAIIDAEGLEALTVRRLATELGVAPMTIYSYVRGKEEILDLVVDRVAADIELPPVEADWRERARELGHSLRAALLAHPDGARLISERPVTSPNAFRLFDAGLGIFRSAGFPDREAVAAYFAFGNYVMGCAAQDTTALRAMRRPKEDHAQSPTPADVVLLLPAERYPNIHALAPYIYGEAGPSPDPPTDGDASDPATARFEFGLESLLDGLGARVRAGGRS
ncbi:MAG: TetR/AcrR family transcriptional regulator [Candidatus Limnocylindrales bacterium]